MRQKIHNAMGKHADEKGQCRSIQQGRQGEKWTQDDKRMQGNRYGMQRRVVQETVE